MTQRSGHLYHFTPPCPEASEASVEPSAEMGRTLEDCGGQDQAGSSVLFHLRSATSTVTGHSQSPPEKAPFLQSQGEKEMMDYMDM